MTTTHSFEVLISLSELFKTSEIDVNNELNVLQFWQTFNILNGIGVSKKKTFNKSMEWLKENVYPCAFHSFKGSDVLPVYNEIAVSAKEP